MSGVKSCRRTRELWALCALSLVLASCGPAPPAPTIVPVAAAIEPSPSMVDEPRLGAGDEEAERCFQRLAASHDLGPTCSDADACVNQCRTPDFEACARLADAAEPHQAPCAQKLRALACGGDHAPSCAALAEQLLRGPTQPATRIRELLEVACEGGVAASCTRLALLEDARLGKRDGGVTKLLERGCDLGDGAACYEAATLHLERAPIDARRGKLLERGCDLGHDLACFRLAREVVFGTLAATTGTPSIADADRMLLALCDGNSSLAGESCFLLSQYGDPQRSVVFRNKACAHRFFNACTQVVVETYAAGRYPEAIALSTEMIAQDPSHWIPRYTRGLSLMDTGQHAAAVPDLEMLCAVRSDWAHCRFWLYAALERSGADGKTQLAASLSDFDAVAWPAPVFQHFLGKLSAAQLLAKAKHTNPTTQLEQECEAYFYIGQQLLIRGQPQQAAAMFQKSVATNITNFIEFTSSKAELALLAHP